MRPGFVDASRGCRAGIPRIKATEAYRPQVSVLAAGGVRVINAEVFEPDSSGTSIVASRDVLPGFASKGGYACVCVCVCVCRAADLTRSVFCVPVSRGSSADQPYQVSVRPILANKLAPLSP